MKRPVDRARLVAGLALCVAPGLHAQAADTDHSAHHPAAPAASAAVAAGLPAQGEVRRIDRAQKKLTLRHGPIVSVDMPPMRMVFQVADERLLNDLAVGDSVRFAVRKVDAALVVTAIEKASR
jgi:Cu/Ag efflux protein CusF